MMLVSLSSYCQYPTVKTINNEQVVIMTLKQGEDINKKFSSLNDTINSLKDTVNKTKNVLNLTVSEKNKLDSLFRINQDKLVVSDREVKKLNELLKENQDIQMRERRNWAAWMVFSFILVIVGFSQ